MCFILTGDVIVNFQFLVQYRVIIGFIDQNIDKGL